jgi:hypothetical protein
MVATMSTRNT